jgi:hypothetical protein
MRPIENIPGTGEERMKNDEEGEFLQYDTL